MRAEQGTVERVTEHRVVVHLDSGRRMPVSFDVAPDVGDRVSVDTSARRLVTAQND